MKKNFYLILYASFIFLVIYLSKQDFTKLPSNVHIALLCISFVFLLSGFILQAYNLQSTLQAFGFRFQFIAVYKAASLSIFAKYIPGKVLTIVGPAQYLKEKYAPQVALPNLLTVTFQSQLLVLWSGMTVGGFLFVTSYDEWLLLYLLIFLVLSLTIFTSFFQDLLKILFLKLFNKKLNIQVISFKQVFKLIPQYFAYWFMFTIGFYFLLTSIISDREIQIWVAAAFPLAATIGIMALFFPGGLGVREGILAGLLNLAGIDTQTALMIAFASRMWFLLGEVLYFGSGLLLKGVSKS